MPRKLLFKSLLVWFLFMPVAILNGIVRNSFYQQFTGELLSHQISTVIASLAFVGMVYLMLRKQLLNLKTMSLVMIGVGWVLMTIIFEFGFGHYIAGHSWGKLFQDYNIFAGRVWIIFLIVCAVSPGIVKKIYQKQSK